MKKIILIFLSSILLNVYGEEAQLPEYTFKSTANEVQNTYIVPTSFDKIPENTEITSRRRALGDDDPPIEEDPSDPMFPIGDCISVFLLFSVIYICVKISKNHNYDLF